MNCSSNLLIFLKTCIYKAFTEIGNCVPLVVVPELCFHKKKTAHGLWLHMSLLSSYISSVPLCTVKDKDLSIS